MDKQLDFLPGAVALGRQMTVEFYDCAAEILADAGSMEKIFLEAARVSGAHVVESNFHSFEPQGVSGVVVISESHFAVHAWPEHDYAAVDLFTCGTGVDFNAAINFLAKQMRSGQWVISSMANRGILHESGKIDRLVPVVENGFSSGLQLSWKERFDHSGARAMSAAVDIYGCAADGFDSEEFWKRFGERIIAGMPGGSGALSGKWMWIPGESGGEFILFASGKKVSGFTVTEKKDLYLTVFADGFFDPRPLAESAVEFLQGRYYRMQVQIRQ